VKNNKQLPQRRGRDQHKQVIKSAAPPEPINDKKFCWSASELDHEYDGDWDWKLDPKEAADLLQLLEDMSQKTWQEVKDLRTGSNRRSRPLHHDQPINSICLAARRRLAQLQVAVESVFRLRKGNTIRVWGYLVGPVFHILWYDRDHKVCPSEN
jgi:hypothetical protein